jgi:Arc/MetJ family transcription regulator
MKTTLLINDDLVAEARRSTGIEEKTRLVHMGLEALIREYARQRLIRLAGAVKKAAAPRRRRVG